MMSMLTIILFYLAGISETYEKNHSLEGNNPAIMLLWLLPRIAQVESSREHANSLYRTVVSRTSTHGCLNITRNFRSYGDQNSIY